MEASQQQATATYEELNEVVCELEDVQTELLRQEEILSRPVYRKRQAIVSRIPHFWPLVFEQAPPEFEPHFKPTDSRVFADSLKSFEVSRFEVGQDGSVVPGGSPRSFKISFEFAPNEWFEDTVLEKKFWFRRARDNWCGLVSEPVRIEWKQGKDLTDGLLDHAVRLFDARKELFGHPDEQSAVKALREWEELTVNSNQHFEGGLSFFAWFAFVSDRRYVTAAESTKAQAADAERREKIRNGANPGPEIEAEIDHWDPEAEIYMDGEELATLLAEDIWPQAIAYFTDAQESSSAEDSDIEVESVEPSDEEVDIRSLVPNKGKNKNGSGPSRSKEF